MKKLLIAVCLLIAVASSAQTPRYDTIRYAKQHYAKRVAIFKKEPIKQGRVIFLGNSITEFADWQKLLGDSTIINRGIAADNTFGVLDRLDDVIAREPSKLFIKIGINDISQDIPVNIIAKNIFTIVQRVKAKCPQTKIYVHSILPTNDNAKKEYPEAFNKNSQVNEVNNRLKQNEKMGFTYIDINMLLRDSQGKLDPQYADADGLHLNEAGYAVWVKLLKAKKYL